MTEIVISRLSFRSAAKVGGFISLIAGISVALAMGGVYLVLSKLNYLDSILGVINELTGFRLTIGWIWATLGSVAVIVSVVGTLLVWSFSTIYNASSMAVGGLKIYTTQHTSITTGSDNI